MLLLLSEGHGRNRPGRCGQRHRLPSRGGTAGAQNGIDVLAIEDPAVVLVVVELAAAGTEFRRGLIEAILRDVTRGDEDVVRQLTEGRSI